ncbi:MAG: hypothetical protein ACD_5C00052G0003 [uncultured bacterium]|nr:MAG: hypothetical protein ACD_5C00052G0003 [uncultured bacterium]
MTFFYSIAIFQILAGVLIWIFNKKIEKIRIWWRSKIGLGTNERLDLIANKVIALILIISGFIELSQILGLWK